MLLELFLLLTFEISIKIEFTGEPLITNRVLVQSACVYVCVGGREIMYVCMIIDIQACVLASIYMYTCVFERDRACIYNHVTVMCVLACMMLLYTQCFISSSAGENINICWSPDGSTIAVGNKDDLVTFIDVRSNRSRAEEQFKFEVNEISWNNEGDLFFLTSGNGSIHIFRYITVALAVWLAISWIDPTVI